MSDNPTSNRPGHRDAPGHSSRRLSGAGGDTLPLFTELEALSASQGKARERRRASALERTSANAGDRTRLLTVAEVCDRLQCGRTYVYALLQKGILRAVKLGRLTRIPLAELEEFIAHKVADAPYDVCERWSRGGDRAAM